MVVVFTIFSLLVFFIIKGAIEKRRNDRFIKQIPIRINVNGIRGKSTITRLITAIIAEAGFNTIGKTTGTAPRVIINQKQEEIVIKRMPRGVSISEQLDVIQWAYGNDAEALVCECMAVNPDYQRVYQEDMIQANIGVIVNVLEDHMDLMGPTLDEVALAFTSTIPYNGYLVIQDNDYVLFFSKIAEERNTKVIIANESLIPENYINQFDYIVFPNNIAIALGVAEALKIDLNVALAGMLKANPDPGVLRVYDIKKETAHFSFINGFAINDPSSTVEMWERLVEQRIIKHSEEKYPIILFNGRADRIDRTEQFIVDCIPNISSKIRMVVIGESVDAFTKSYQSGQMTNVIDYLDLSEEKIEFIEERLFTLFDGETVFAIGNIHGHAHDLLSSLNIEI